MVVSLAIPPSARASVVGIETKFQNLQAAGTALFPQHGGVVGQGSSAVVYDLTKRDFNSSLEVAQVYGFGSPLHLVARQLFPDNGDGVGVIPITFHPLDDDVAGVPSLGNIAPTVAQTVASSYIVRINNIDSTPFVIDTTDSVASVVLSIVAAVNAVLEEPVIATDNISVSADLTSKWEGLSANGIFIEIIGDFTLGTTFVITQPVGGLVNPDVQPALDQIGEVWESMLVNCMEIDDSAALIAYDAFGEGKWQPLEHQPLMVFTGTTETSASTAIIIPDGRKIDRTNSQLVAPSCNNLPFVVAAREMARVIVLANTIPPHSYQGQRATGLVPGPDGDQWDFNDRDLAIKGGSSSIVVKDGVINLSDTVTFYHPDGEANPAYQYVVDVVRLQNILFNIAQIFESPEWKGAPLIPDNQATTEATAKKPKDAKAALNTMIDNLGLRAILSAPEIAKPKTQAVISATNPNRLDTSITIQLSGNTNQSSITLNYGFFFGDAALAA